LKKDAAEELQLIILTSGFFTISSSSRPMRSILSSVTSPTVRTVLFF